MGRKSGPLTRCGGLWSEAKFKSFIRGNLRMASRKWAPIKKALEKARVSRGNYLCAGCNNIVPASIRIGSKRVKNAIVDHINPIIDPEVGWVSWDETIDRMFCEEENLQVLCYTCHEEKTNEEKQKAKARRSKDNEYDEDEQEA